MTSSQTCPYEEQKDNEWRHSGTWKARSIDAIANCNIKRRISLSNACAIGVCYLRVDVCLLRAHKRAY